MVSHCSYFLDNKIVCGFSLEILLLLLDSQRCPQLSLFSSVTGVVILTKRLCNFGNYSSTEIMVGNCKKEERAFPWAPGSLTIIPVPLTGDNNHEIIIPKLREELGSIDPYLFPGIYWLLLILTDQRQEA